MRRRLLRRRVRRAPRGHPGQEHHHHVHDPMPVHGLLMLGIGPREDGDVIEHLPLAGTSILPKYRPDDHRREFRSSIHCYRPEHYDLHPLAAIELLP